MSDEPPLLPGHRALDIPKVGLRVRDLLAILIHYHPNTELRIGKDTSSGVPIDHMEMAYGPDYLETEDKQVARILLVPVKRKAK